MYTVVQQLRALKEPIVYYCTISESAKLVVLWTSHSTCTNVCWADFWNELCIKYKMCHCVSSIINYLYLLDAIELFYYCTAIETCCGGTMYTKYTNVYLLLIVDIVQKVSLI